MTDGHAPAGDHALLARGAWWHARHPRRDRPGVPEPDAPDEARAARAASLVDGVRGEIDNVLALPGTDPAIAEAARAYLGGAADPLGAAAVAHIAGITGFLDGRPDGPSFPHAWVARHGDAFAAAAVAELGGIAADATYVRPGYAWGGVRARAPRDTSGAWWLHIGDARWLRTRLAAAPDDVYAAAVAELAARRGHELQKLVAAYLAPTRGDWVEELCGNPGAAADVTFHGRWLLFCALGAPHQPAALGLAVGYRDRDPGVLTSLVDGVGAEAAAPLIVEALEQDLSRGTQAGALPEVLAGLPVDAACRALVDRIDRPGFPPAVLAAARGFPARVLPLLAASDSARAADLLAARVRAEPDLAASLLPDRPAEARLPDAADLPPLLTEPPWTKSRTGAEPLVLENLPAPGVTAVAWAPGEREEWAAHAEAGSGYRPLSEREIAEFDAGDLPWFREVALFTEGPDDQARPRLRTWEPESEWDAERWLPVVVARFEADAAGAAVSVARRAPTALGRFLLPLLSDEIARTMADWLVRLKTAAQEARAWFARHGAAAAPALIPDALGKAGRRRGAAEAALRLIADREGAGPVVAAARVHGDAAAAAIEALVTADPLDKLPAVIPSADWVELRALPRLLLRGRTHALPDEAVAHVLTMLAMSKPDEVYAGVPAVVELCDRESLAEFGWALFRWWEACGSSSKENWALTQLGLTGDDGTVLRLAPVIRAWPGESGHARAVLGLDVLAAIGTETALTNLHSIAQRVKFKGLKAKAQEKIEEVAAGLGLT
ncbi:hypothetical protein, partial [Actinomadura rifamycini]|uniref:hypothetical protein n=1 Tax=Actinomadura rifamycini TaxID=31962 RepID=UPI001B7FB326